LADTDIANAEISLCLVIVLPHFETLFCTSARIWHYRDALARAGVIFQKFFNHVVSLLQRNMALFLQ
jgi:hypothetical protein